MAFTLTECADKARWDQLVNDSPQGSVFCLTPFLDALGEAYCLFLVEEHSKVQLGIVMVLRDGHSAARINSPPRPRRRASRRTSIFATSARCGWLSGMARTTCSAVVDRGGEWR